MSFIGETNGKTYAPGYFLAKEDCDRVTREIPQSMATTAANGSKYVKAGTPFPSNDANIKGFVYEDVDVTTGNMPGSVVTAGKVVESRLPLTLTSTAKTAIANLDFELITSDSSVTRPY